ncbi:MAG: D-alanyl-D-alanine carboxypeptidase family protein [Candidatus Ventricola sp.]
MNRSSRRAPQDNPLLRVLIAALAVVLIVVLCVAANSLMPRIDPAIYEPTPSPTAPGATATPLPTPTPEPTITPTPAVYAPFGAQFGFGGEALIPETPTPTPAPAGVTPSPAPTPEPTAAPARTLKKGMNGEDVRLLQYALIDLGYLTGSADGVFGSATEEALIRFQAVNSLQADGLAGARTQEKLYGGGALSADQAPKTDRLILVNRDHPLTRQDVPSDLVRIEDVLSSDVVKVKYAGTQANREAVDALGKMLQAAIADGVTGFQISSAYRKYSDQQALVDQSVAKYRKSNPSWSRERCLSATYQTVAPAGASEHQTGLAFDITVPGVSFSGTAQQKWLHAHCHEYGFVVRFTEDKQKLTGFLAESWHFRYVGVDAARVMTDNHWCLEEYVEKLGLYAQ